MTSLRLGLLFGLLPFLLAVGATAQRRSDPLTEPEIDQLRDTALDPDRRLKLYVDFARARLTALEQVRSDPKIVDKGAAIHDRLQDFEGVYDELDDNLDTFNSRNDDLRKVLKVILEADAEFQSRLRAVKDAAVDNKDEEKKYEFILADVLDDVNSGAADHRQLLAEQEEAAKHKKEHKH